MGRASSAVQISIRDNGEVRELIGLFVDQSDLSQEDLHAFNLAQKSATHKDSA